jgi:hypothetical protein
VNRTHVEYLNGQLAVGGWQPNLPRLEAIKSAADMTQLDYAEAWLWVHFLLESPDGHASVLTTFLTDLYRAEPPSPLSERIRAAIPKADAAVVAHLKSLPVDAVGN